MPGRKRKRTRSASNASDDGGDVAFYLDDRFIDFCRQLGLFEPFTVPERRTLDLRSVHTYARDLLFVAVYQRITGLWNLGSHNAIFCPSIELEWTIKRHADLLGGDGKRLRRGEELRTMVRRMWRYEVLPAVARSGGLRWIIVPFSWYWTDPQRREEDSHATLLIFDRAEQTYRLYDPNNGLVAMYLVQRPNHPQREYVWRGRRQTLLQQLPRPLLDDFRFVPVVARGGVPSLQEVIERSVAERPKTAVSTRCVHRRVGDGLCSMLTMLILNFCLRYQIPDVWRVSNAAGEALTRHWRTLVDRLDAREHFRMRLGLWFQQFFTRMNTWVKIEQSVGLLPPRGTLPSCGVYDAVRRTHCTSTPCAGHAYCETHRHDLLIGSWRNPQGIPHEKGCHVPILWDRVLTKKTPIAYPPPKKSIDLTVDDAARPAGRTKKIQAVNR